MLKRMGEKKLGRKQSHRRAMVINQMRSLFKSGYITTTSQRAKVLKSNAESFVSKVNNSNEDLTLFRYVKNYIGTPKVDELIKNIKDNNVNISIVKIGFRAGDNAEVSKVIVNGLELKAKRKGRKVEAAKKETKEVEAKVEAKEETKKGFAKDDKGLGNRISKSLKSTFTGTKERARTRSGL